MLLSRTLQCASSPMTPAAAAPRPLLTTTWRPAVPQAGRRRRKWHSHDPAAARSAVKAAAVDTAEAAASQGEAAPPPRPRQEQQACATFAEVQQAARNRGLTITLSEAGPLYRITCTESGTAPSAGQQQQRRQGSGAEGRVVALTTGFVAPPFGLMHCDTLQVFTRGLRGEEGQRVRGGALGLGLLMGGAVFSYGLSKGCHKAEILAINDDDSMHARLVTYYSYFGFRPVRVVEGDKLSDLPHMLVWGGAGTRMDADVGRMLRKWTPALRRMAAAAAASEAATD